MMGILRGAITLTLLALFIALIAWAWSGRRKKLFDSMARMALDEDDAAKLEETRHE
jgi:cytochrome c oxidase cbb3-type subunit 4